MHVEHLRYLNRPRADLNGTVGSDGCLVCTDLNPKCSCAFDEDCIIITQCVLLTSFISHPPSTRGD